LGKILIFLSFWNPSATLPIKDRNLICADFLSFFHFIFQELFLNLNFFYYGCLLDIFLIPVGVSPNLKKMTAYISENY